MPTAPDGRPAPSPGKRQVRRRIKARAPKERRQPTPGASGKPSAPKGSPPRCQRCAAVLAMPGPQTCWRCGGAADQRMVIPDKPLPKLARPSGLYFRVGITSASGRYSDWLVTNRGAADRTGEYVGGDCYAELYIAKE